MKELGKLFEHTLMDIYYAETQILKALPKLAQKAKSPDLKKAFESHLRPSRRPWSGATADAGLAGAQATARRRNRS